MNDTAASDSEDAYWIEKIVVTSIIVAVGIDGFILSALWTYSTYLTLKDTKITDQTRNIVASLYHLFIIGILNTVVSNGLLFVWIWLYYNAMSNGRIVILGLIVSFLIFEPLALLVIAFNRFKSSNQVHFKLNFTWPVLLIASVLVGVGSSLVEWSIGIYSGFMLPGSICIAVYILNIFLSVKTHQNIVSRFPNEKSKSSKILALSSISYFALFTPLEVTSFLVFFGSGGNDLYLLSSILVSRLSSILNGFIYGWSNRRIQPNFCKLFKQTRTTPPKREIVGETNEAFSDQVL